MHALCPVSRLKREYRLNTVYSLNAGVTVCNRCRYEKSGPVADPMTDAEHRPMAAAQGTPRGRVPAVASPSTPVAWPLTPLATGEKARRKRPQPKVPPSLNRTRRAVDASLPPGAVSFWLVGFGLPHGSCENEWSGMWCAGAILNALYYAEYKASVNTMYVAFPF